MFGNVDKLALCLKRTKHLPPSEYDHAYNGNLFVKRAIYQEALRKTCGHTPKAGVTISGCADAYYTHTDGRTGCIIYLAWEDDITAQDCSYDMKLAIVMGGRQTMKEPDK